MTHQEFTEKTGLALAIQDFNRVYDMYLCAGDHMDEASFCDDFKQHYTSKLLQVFYSRFSALEDKIDALEEEKIDIAIALMERKDPKDYELAIKLIGQRSATLYKLENNLELNYADLQYIKSMLEGSF
jgi:hypothetical protein